jgi:4-amino-4-deoxy-L-arabinose transferase-like glycosyltransferase
MQSRGNRMMDIIKRSGKSPYLYGFLLLLALSLLLTQAFIYAHQMPSRVDEGSFLIKGYDFVKGIYKPFQDYGPWTNNMPLAYYIPGLAQAIFGPGLKTGRYFAIFMLLLTLLGMWLLVRRIKGKWWALLSLTIVALNPALIKIYVQAVSEVIVACLLTWALFFLVGERRSLWQISAGALLCSLTALTRQNMIFLIPFFILYAFFLYGKEEALAALLGSVLPFLIVHILFFPQIMDLWYSWIPRSILKILNVKVISGGGKQVWTPAVGLLTRFTSFFTAIRYYFIPLLGVFICLVTLPSKKNWGSKYERKLAASLVVLFGLLFLLHAWAALTKNYCVYCFPNYLAFFIPIAILLAMIVFHNLRTICPKISSGWVIGLILAGIPGVFLGSLETVGRWVMALPVPRIKGGALLSGSTELWKLFENRFGWTYDQLIAFIPPLFGLLVAILILELGYIFYRISSKKLSIPFGNFLLVGLIMLAFIFSPSPLLADMPTENPCGGDVLAAFESAGRQLDDLIPAGSEVYWAAGSVVTPLLYITDTTYPPQLLNGVYSKRIGGDRELLEKEGYYNSESVKQWRSDADYVINSNVNMSENWKTFLNADDFNEYEHTVPLDPCEPASYLRIFKKK